MFVLQLLEKSFQRFARIDIVELEYYRGRAFCGNFYFYLVDDRVV